MRVRNCAGVMFSEFLQDRGDYVARHVVAQALEAGAALVEVSLRVDADFVPLPHFEGWPRKQHLARDALRQRDFQIGAALHHRGAPRGLIGDDGIRTEDQHRAVQDRIGGPGIVHDLVVRAFDEFARDIGWQTLRQPVLDRLVQKRSDGDGVDCLRHDVRSAGYVIAAAGGAQHHSEYDDCNPSHKNWLIRNWLPTTTAFSAASRRLSAASQHQQACGSLRSIFTATTAPPSCPATPTAVGGSRSERRTSMRSSVKADSTASTPGFSSNSTHSERL